MSFQEIENLRKTDLKNKLSQMGMSLDRIDHPRDYYAQLYLEKSNAKNKVTRGNTPFYKNKILRGKRERGRIKETDKELIDDPNYEEEEYEEEEEIFDKDNEDLMSEESEEKEGKNLSKRKIKKVKIDETTNDYRTSGIKITRLIRKKKEKVPKINKQLVKKENQQSNVRRRILNNYNEMAGENDYYENNNTENYLIGENTQNQNMNIPQGYSSKNNEFNNIKNNSYLPEKKNDIITLKVERVEKMGGGNTNNNIINQNLRKQIKKEYNKTYLLGSPKEPSQNKEVEIKSNNNIISFGAPDDRIQTNIHNLSNGPISFGVNQSSAISNSKIVNDVEKANKNGNESKQYDFFLKNISESIKEDVKDNQNSFKPKKVLIKWDTPKQKEFLFSSMEKEQTFKRPSEEEMNNLNKINLQSKFETKDNENEKILINQPRNQIVSDSIQHTTINQNINGNHNYNMNNNENNNYKAKLRSYRPKNEFELNKSNGLNDNKENISKKVEVDTNNLNETEYNNMNNLDEIEYNDMNNLDEIEYSDMNNLNENDNNKDYKGLANNNYLKNAKENMNTNKNENMNKYIKLTNNINKYNNQDNKPYLNKNIKQSNLIGHNLIDDNNTNNYKEKDIEMKDNNMKYLSNNDNNNIDYVEKVFEIKDNNDMKSFSNVGNNNNINKKYIEMKDKNNMKYFSNDGNNTNNYKEKAIEMTDNNNEKYFTNYGKYNINEKDIKMKDNNTKYFTNNGDNSNFNEENIEMMDNNNMKNLTNDCNNNYNINMNNNENKNNLYKENINYLNPYRMYEKHINEKQNYNNNWNPNIMTVNNMIKYNNENDNINNNINSYSNNSNESSMNTNGDQMKNKAQIYLTDNNELNNEYQESRKKFGISENKKSKKLKFGANLKNSILNKFKNSVYLWPLILLIVFGLFYFLNNKIHNFSNLSLISIFSLIMGLILLYNLFKYYAKMKNYKKMAKEDRDKLIEYLDTNNITREELGNNKILTNNFIKSRIQHHKIKVKEYKDYVLPYLIKYLKKDNYSLKIEEMNSEVNNISYWKEI